jgi:hypothetical protein
MTQCYINNARASIPHGDGSYRKQFRIFSCEGQFWAIFHAKNITHFTSQKLGYSISGERESVKCDDWFWHDRADS